MAAIACVVMRHRKKNPSKTAGPSRASHARKARASYEQMLKDDQARMLLQTHDKSHTGKLNREELGALLTEHAGGVVPTDEELDFVLNAADESDGRINGQVNLHEINHALQSWIAIRQNKARVEEYFKKYDISGDGKLNANEMRVLLTDLNDGVEVEEEELNWIMEHSDGLQAEKTGGINRTELTHALALWYSHVEDEKAHCGGHSCAVM